MSEATRPMLFLCFTAFIGLTVLFATNKTAHGQSGCAQLDKSQSLLYVSYERDADGKILLGLHNNTSCDIYIQTNNGPTMYRVINLVGGKTRLEKRVKDDAYDLSQNEILTDLIYELRDDRNNRRILTTADGDLIFTRRFPAGVTIYFTVPRSSIKSHANVAIPFRYPWEEQAVPIRGGNAAHQVYFAWPEQLVTQK